MELKLPIKGSIPWLDLTRLSLDTRLPTAVANGYQNWEGATARSAHVTGYSPAIFRSGGSVLTHTPL